MRAAQAGAGREGRCLQLGFGPVLSSLRRSYGWAGGFGKARRLLFRARTAGRCNRRIPRGLAASRSCSVALSLLAPKIRNVDIRLLHSNRNVCVPGNVNLVANLDLIEHSRISDTSVVFPSVRPVKVMDDALYRYR